MSRRKQAARTPRVLVLLLAVGALCWAFDRYETQQTSRSPACDEASGACRDRPKPTSNPKPEPQAKGHDAVEQAYVSYTIHFTTNQHGRPESGCNRTLCRELKSQIDGARTSIDFAVYGLRAQPAILSALVAARQRGVVVHGVVDTEDSACTKFEYADTTTLMSALGREQVRCDSGPGASAIMHNKFFVFDRHTVWTGSTNISDTELGGEYNTDVAVTLHAPSVAAAYHTELDEMLGGQFHHRKTDNTEHDFALNSDTGPLRIKSYFSPSDHSLASTVLPLIRGAHKTLDIALFFFTNTAAADAILEAAQRGVSVRLIMDAGGAANRHSQHRVLCERGLTVKTENWGGKAHSKWAVADAETDRAAVVFGSMNWTDSGDRDNDENTLYVQSRAFASAFHAEFEREWADLSAVPSCKRIAVEGADSSRCTGGDCRERCLSGSCCDGIDNDYDGLTDASEEACGCNDGLDNDGDGTIDRDDYDCRPALDR